MTKEKIYPERGDGFLIDQTYCVACEVEGKEACNSSDALALYEHDLIHPNTQEVLGTTYTGFCFSCNQPFFPDELSKTSLAETLGFDSDGEVRERKPFERAAIQPPMARQEVLDLIDKVGFPETQYRGIRREVRKFFGHLVEYDACGNPKHVYYPETEKGSGFPVGYKIRHHKTYIDENGKRKKIFTKVGKTGVRNELAGQLRFNHYDNHRDLLIVGGEEDLPAAYQMLLDHQKSKYGESFAPTAVVSPTCGEPSVVKQVRNNYDFFDKFDNIIIGLDNDEKGREMAIELAEILPREKVKVVYWTDGDPSAALQAGRERQFISDWYSAKSYYSDGVKTSIEADEEMEMELAREKISLPDFMSEIEDSMAGGIPLGYMVNFIAESGIGKTSIINEAVRHWIFSTRYKVGIVSLELTAGQYMVAMTSREVGYKINLIKDPKEAIEFINQPHVKEARNKLKYREDGEERFALLDERDGELDEVKRQIEKLIGKYDCKIIVIDPIQDLFEGVDMKEQNSFLKYLKSLLKRGITICNICHVRKSTASTNKEGKRIIRELTEDDVHGISAIIKSAGANLFFTRDKYAEDVTVRNTTNATLGKCRWTGITGKVGEFYYDNQTHTMYNKAEFFSDPDNLKHLEVMGEEDEIF